MTERQSDEVYEPTATDIAWTRNLLRLLKPQAVWAYPGATLMYDIDQDEKKVWLEFPPLGSLDPFQLRMHRRVKACFSVLGFSMEEDLPKEPA